MKRLKCLDIICRVFIFTQKRKYSSILVLLLLFNIQINFQLYSQEIERIQIGKSLNENNIFPTIEGVHDGEIFIEKLGSVNGLQTINGLKIISFHLEFPYGAGTKSFDLNSNLIPDSIVLDIRKSCLNEPIFITKIKAINDKNEIYLLQSMKLIPKLNED